MKMKKEFGKRDSFTLLLCILLPPLGFGLAAQRQWIGMPAAVLGSVCYAVAIIGLLGAAYPHTANDLVRFNAMWGLVMAAAISGQYLAGQAPVLAIRLALLVLLAGLAWCYLPVDGMQCLPHCDAPTLRTLKGQTVALLPGTAMLMLLGALLALWVQAAYLSVANRDR